MPTAPRTTLTKPFERRVMAIAAVICLHFALVWVAIAASVFVAAHYGNFRLYPSDPAIIMIALISAECSLGAIWWSRTTWPAHLKTLVGVIICVDLWALLMGLLDSVHREPIAAACWAIALMLQVGLTALASSIVEASLKTSSSSRRQFSILYLIIWTTVIAILLGTARRVMELNHWTLPGAFGWRFANQLFWCGAVNAILAISLLASVRLPRTWRIRVCASIATLCVFTVTAPFLTAALFGSSNLGTDPTFADLAWLWCAEGLFLLAALIPLEIAREPNELAVARAAP